MAISRQTNLKTQKKYKIPIGGALAGFVVGALRGFRAGKDASKDMGQKTEI